MTDTSKPEHTTVELLKEGSLETEIRPYDLGEGYVVDNNELGVSRLKVAEDGHTVLIPQPSNDPEDPLNWTKYKKHLFLLIIAASAFLPDYGSAVGAVTLLPQAKCVLLSFHPSILFQSLLETDLFPSESGD